ncbi:MAG TPA: hypothetical protein VII52_06830 [Gemmatimonadaceae bacterium]
MSRHSFAAFALFASVLGIGTACRSANPYAMDQEIPGMALVVRNNNFNNMDVYAISAGLPTRIGTVTGNSAQSFKLHESFYTSSGDFRIVATPIGGNGRASSGQIAVSPGETIYFTIGSQLRQSSVTIR